MWDKIDRLIGENGTVVKYVFQKEDAVAESVLYKYPTYLDRTVICCSTQSGCPVGCRFCGAGDYFVRNLYVDEIISQPVQLLLDTGVNPLDMKRLQIMYMSMGEPLLNLKNLIPAIRSLSERFPNAAQLISTSGPNVSYEPLFDLAREISTVGLQFSVHESTDEARNKLIPFVNKLTLEEIAIMGERFFQVTGRSPFFNYCVHDKNNTDEDVGRLKKLFNNAIWQATISVICERDEHVAAANSRQYQLACDFRTKLQLNGYSTRVFNPASQDDVGGGCGQLWYVQEWMHKNPELALQSIGFGKEKVHTPHELPQYGAAANT